MRPLSFGSPHGQTTENKIDWIIECLRQLETATHGGDVLAVAEGGTGASTAAAAATNLGLGTTDQVSFGSQITVTSTDAGAGPGPTIIFDRNSASPAASDYVGMFVQRGRSSTGVARDYGTFAVMVDDPTNTSEDSHYEFFPYVAGNQPNAFSIGAGVAVGSPTGGRKGTGSVNVTGLYINGAEITFGTYSPPITNGANVDSTSSPTGMFTRVGSVAHVSGSVSVDPTAGATPTTIDIEFPIASNITATTEVIGILIESTGGVVAPITGSIADDRATVTFTSVGTTALTYTFQFTYHVV